LHKHAFKIEDFNSEALDCNPSGYHGFPLKKNQQSRAPPLHARAKHKIVTLWVTMMKRFAVKIKDFKKA